MYIMRLSQKFAPLAIYFLSNSEIRILQIL